MTESRRRDWFAFVFLAFLPTLAFLDVVIGKGVFYVRDVALYHFPGKRMLREIVLRGEFPFWNAWISAGQPLAANPAHEVFYPLTWLILLPDYIYWFQILALVHVYIASFGTYFLLRSLPVSRAASVFGAFSFGLGGFVLSGLQLFPFLFSASWMPLTLLFGRQALLGRTMRDFALATLFLGIQCLVGEPVVLVQTGLILGLYAIAIAVEDHDARQMLRNLTLVAAVGVGGVLVAAVQILPGIDHARDSVRSTGFTFDLVSGWSTPPVRFAELLFPDVFGSRVLDSDAPRWGQKIYEGRPDGFFVGIYPGMIATLLALAGVASGAKGRGLFVAVAALSTVLALGSFTPLLRLLYDAGIADAIRYPEKFLIMGLFAISIYGAITLNQLLAGDARVRRAAVFVGCAILTAAGIGFLSTAVSDAESNFRALWSIEPERDVMPLLSSARTGWALAAARAVVFLVAVVFLIRMPRRVAALLFVGMLSVDLARESGEIAPRTERQFYAQASPSIAQLPLTRSDYRIFRPGDLSAKAIHSEPYGYRRPHFFLIQRNALVGLAPLTYGIRTAMDVDFDLTSLTTTDAFGRAMWKLADKSGDWLNYSAAMSNVWYVAMYRPFEQAVAEAGGDARLLQPIRWVAGLRYPRYYFASKVVPIRSADDFVDKLASGSYPRNAAFIEGSEGAFEPAAGRVVRWTETPNSARIEVESGGLSFLVMSVSNHKYWTVAIDGIEVGAIPSNLAYQGVLVPPGRHVVAMRYHNPLIAAGASISGLALLTLGVLVFRRRPIGTMRAL